MTTTLCIHYTGQLASLLGTAEESMEVVPGMRLQAVVERILSRHGAKAEPFFRGGQGGLPATLLVIFDGEQVDGDRSGRDVAGVRDLMFMSPMAGG